MVQKKMIEFYVREIKSHRDTCGLWINESLTGQHGPNIPASESRDFKLWFDSWIAANLDNILECLG